MEKQPESLGASKTFALLVTEKQRLIEKAPGLDDVYLVTFDSGRSIQVDRPVFEALELDRPVSKQAWSRTLQCDGRLVHIDWSPDFRGMVYSMPLIAVLLGLIGLLTIRASGSPSQAAISHRTTHG